MDFAEPIEKRTGPEKRAMVLSGAWGDLQIPAGAKENRALIRSDRNCRYLYETKF